MIKDISFEINYDGNILTRIIKIDFLEILENINYLKQIFDVLNVHYSCLLIKPPFKDPEELFNHLKNLNSNVEFHFTFIKSGKDESKVLIIQK